MKSCLICGINTNLIKHHISYEPDEEIIIVCKKHHGLIHSDSNFLKQFKPKNRGINRIKEQQLQNKYREINGMFNRKKWMIAWRIEWRLNRTGNG